MSASPEHSSDARQRSVRDRAAGSVRAIAASFAIIVAVAVITFVSTATVESAMASSLIADRALPLHADGAAIPPPPGVPPADVAPREVRDVAGRSLADVITMLGPLPSAEGASIAPLDPDSAEAHDVARRTARGTEALTLGKPLKAIPDFEAALTIDPANTGLLRLLAQAFAQVGNEGRALNVYERLLVLDPDDAQALVATGTAAAAARRFEDSVRRIAAGLEASSASKKPLPAVSRVIADRVMGGALRELEFDGAAIETWSRALDAIAELDAAQAAAPNEPRQDLTRARVELLLARADARTRLGDFESALGDLQAIVNIPGVDRDAVLPRELFVLESAGKRNDADARLAATIADVAGPSDREVDLAKWLVEIDAERPALIEAARRAAAVDAESLTRARLLAVVDRKAGVDALAVILDKTPGDAAALRSYLADASGDDADALATALLQRLRVAPEHAAAATAAALGTRVSERSLRTALATQPPSTARTLALTRIAMLGRDFGPAWTTLAAAREKDPNDLGLAIAQVDLAGALEEPALLRALERGRPGTPGGLPQESAVELAIALAYRTAGDFAASRERLERLHDQEVSAASAPLARMLTDFTATLRPEDPVRAAMAARAVTIAEGSLARDAANEEAALTLLRLRDPRAGAEADADAWKALRTELRSGSLAWLDERVSIEEEIARARVELATARLVALAERRTFDSELVGLAVSLMARAGRASDASAWLDGLLERQPALISLRDARTAASAQSGGAEEMVETLKATIADDPGDALAAWHLEAVLRAAGRPEEASERSRDRLLARPEGVRRALELANLEQRAERPSVALAALDTVVQADEISSVQRLAAVEIVSRLPTSIPGRSATLIALAEPGLDAADADAVIYAAAASMGVMDDARGGSRSEEREAIERLRELAAKAAATETGGSSDLAAALRWRDSAQMFIDAEAPTAGAEFLRARLADPSALPPVAFRALVSAAFASDAAARERADRSIELLRDLRAKGVKPFDWTRGGAENEADALLQLSTLYSLVGDREGSERILEVLLESSPDHAMALNNLAWARVERGAVDERTADLASRALLGAPDEAAILDTTGWIRYLQGQLHDDTVADRAGALTLLRRSVEAGARDPSLEVLDHMGDALWAAQDVDGARSAWQDAVRIAAERFDRAATLPQLNGYLLGECGVRLVDPEVFYDEHFGRPAQRAARKLADIDAGRDPITPPASIRTTTPDGAAHP